MPLRIKAIALKTADPAASLIREGIEQCRSVELWIEATKGIFVTLGKRLFLSLADRLKDRVISYRAKRQR
jgi:hypothetical protein